MQYGTNYEEKKKCPTWQKDHLTWHKGVRIQRELLGGTELGLISEDSWVDIGGLGKHKGEIG